MPPDHKDNLVALNTLTDFQSRKQAAFHDFVHQFDPVQFALEVLGFSPDPVQAQLMHTQHRRVIVNCSRQWGKSTTAAAIAAHRLIHGPDNSLSIVISPSARQSGELIRKVAAFLSRTGVKIKGDGDNDISILHPNGSRIVGLPGRDHTTRGFSAVSLLIIDEASRVTDTVYRAVRPMLTASNGRLFLLSTPYGKRGFFFNEWMRAAQSENSPIPWTRVSVPASLCQRLAPELLEEEKIALGENFFNQEYNCEFLDTQDQSFPYSLVYGAFSKEVEPI